MNNEINPTFLEAAELIFDEESFQTFSCVALVDAETDNNILDNHCTKIYAEYFGKDGRVEVFDIRYADLVGSRIFKDNTDECIYGWYEQHGETLKEMRIMALLLIGFIFENK